MSDRVLVALTEDTYQWLTEIRNKRDSSVKARALWMWICLAGTYDIWLLTEGGGVE